MLGREAEASSSEGRTMTDSLTRTTTQPHVSCGCADDDIGSRYVVRCFTEDQDPAAALAARRIHAESYLFAGHVRPTALSADGTLCAGLDPATGPALTYVVAERRGGPTSEPDVATARIVRPAGGEDFRDLHAYRLSAEALSPETLDLIWRHSRQHGRESVGEVAALARSIRGTTTSSLVLLRALAHVGASRCPPQLWLAVIVPASLAALETTLGERVIRRAGPTVPGYPDDPRVSPRLQFVPVLIDAAHILEALAGSVTSAPTARRRSQLRRTLQFFEKGTPPEARGDAVGTCLGTSG